MTNIIILAIVIITGFICLKIISF